MLVWSVVLVRECVPVIGWSCVITVVDADGRC